MVYLHATTRHYKWDIEWNALELYIYPIKKILRDPVQQPGTTLRRQVEVFIFFFFEKLVQHLIWRVLFLGEGRVWNSHEIHCDKSFGASCGTFSRRTDSVEGVGREQNV